MWAVGKTSEMAKMNEAKFGLANFRQTCQTTIINYTLLSLNQSE